MAQTGTEKKKFCPDIVVSKSEVVFRYVITGNEKDALHLEKCLEGKELTTL
jgi:hypothetical protein